MADFELILSSEHHSSNGLQSNCVPLPMTKAYGIPDQHTIAFQRKFLIAPVVIVAKGSTFAHYRAEHGAEGCGDAPFFCPTPQPFKIPLHPCREVGDGAEIRRYFCSYSYCTQLI